MKDKTTIKSRIKTLKAILYTVMFFWLVILIYTIYDLLQNEINPYLVLALILVSVFNECHQPAKKRSTEKTFRIRGRR